MSSQEQEKCTKKDFEEFSSPLQNLENIPSQKRLISSAFIISP